MHILGKLNRLRIIIGDVGNVYLEALTKERLYIVAGPKFGDLEGCFFIVQKALYGLSTSGARWAEQLEYSLRNLGFLLSYADLAIWMREHNNH